MPSLEWYWHRLRAMSAGEVALRIRKKFRELADSTLEHDWAGSPIESSGAFPKLPEKPAAPESLRSALRRDADNILAGRWRAFGHLELKVDDPPRWHCDYLAGRDLATTASAFRLDYRELPGGADIKLIWELSRWHALARLAQAAWLLDDEKAGEKCVLWLEDWVKHNQPFRGWNWTSALEAGLRLINFAWMDALLAPNAERWAFDAELDRLRHEILPPHAWFTWRHKSFGSSANNHLIGELAGLIVATARWPALAPWAAPLDELQRRWEHEVLAQFHEDGGNKEQALNYHLFSWELCWHARAALVATGRVIAPAVEERLRRAAQFYVDVQVPSDPWDYGDSDNAFVLPVTRDCYGMIETWHSWLAGKSTPELAFWLGNPPSLPVESRLEEAIFGMPPAEEDKGERPYPNLVSDGSSFASVFNKSGIAILKARGWTLRWDVSPLGYLATSAHGHLDVFHLSLWLNGVAMVVDPGTGGYFSDSRLRHWLASGPAHNGPRVTPEDWVERQGPFLWSRQHDTPIGIGGRIWSLPQALIKDAFESGIGKLVRESYERGDAVEALMGLVKLYMKGTSNPWALTRQFSLVTKEGPIRVMDTASKGMRPMRRAPFSVRWQFAPGAKLEQLTPRRFCVTRRGVAMDVEVSADWAEVWAVSDRNDPAFMQAEKTDEERKFAGIVSPAFRKTEWAPYLKLVARPGEKPCLFTTTFLASRDA